MSGSSIRSGLSFTSSSHWNATLKRSEWIAPLDDYVAADAEFDQDDVLAPMTASLSGDDGRLYGRGFKILLDLIAAARGAARIVEMPYRMRSRLHGESKLSARVVAEFFMLVLYHLFGRLLPARFFLFAAVGVTGLAVHLAVLWAVYGFSGNFLASQAAATCSSASSRTPSSSSG